MSTTSAPANIANIHHPERQPGEVFLGNFTLDEFVGFIGWKSKRLGVQALSLSGEPASSQLSPTFAQEAELIAAGFLVNDGVISTPGALPVVHA